MPVRFCKPLIPDMEEVDKRLERSFQSGHLSNFGACYHLLKEELVKFLAVDDSRDLSVVSSGHTALMTAFATLGVRSPVIPAFTFESTRSAASLQGIEPVLCDVNPQTGCITVPILEGIPSDTYDSVVAVCALSTIPNLQELHDYCKGEGKALIIDGAATFGTPNIVNYGDAFCLSFHATKTFSVGEGGAVILPKRLTSLARSFMNFGFDSNKNIAITGMNAKVSEYTCAVALTLLEVVDKEIEARKKNAALFKSKIGRFIPHSFSEETVYSALPTFLPSKGFSIRLREILRQSEIECLAYYKPVEKLPVSEDLYSRSVCLPIHSGLSEEDIETICYFYSRI